MNVQQLIKAIDICSGYGITGLRQLKVILAFAEADYRQLDFTELAIRSNINKPGVCRALDMLYSLGLTSRTVNEDHHLKRWINLTPKGQQLAKQLGGK